MLLTRFCKVEPSWFRVGDIVEVQITVAAVPIRNNKFKMISYLRCLALLDGTFTDVSVLYQIWIIIIWLHAQWKLAMTDRLKATARPTVMKLTIKRKVGYNATDDEMSEARNKMVNMTMNDREYWFHKVGLENH